MSSKKSNKKEGKLHLSHRYSTTVQPNGNITTTFRPDSGIEYQMIFKQEGTISESVYEFSFFTQHRTEYKLTTGIDHSIESGIADHLRDFCNSGRMAYFIYSYEDNHAKCRARLFARWFRRYGDDNIVWIDYEITYQNSNQIECLTIVVLKTLYESDKFEELIKSITNELEVDGDKAIAKVN